MTKTAKVDGIDAFMIYADDPQRTAEFYRRHLGIGTKLEADGNRYGEVPDERAGKAVHVGIYPSEDGPLGRRRSVMMNFRVPDLDAFVERLRADGVEVGEVVDEGYGKFAHFTDPEGHPIEIWQPVGESPKLAEGDS